MDKQQKPTICYVEKVGDRWRVTVVKEGKKDTVYWFKSKEGAQAFADAEEWASRDG